MKTQQLWNAAHYDDKLAFVSKYGEDLLTLLDAKPGQAVLDLGCGSGDLAAGIASTGAKVIGLDYSAEMVAKANEKYPTISFLVGDGEHFQLEHKVDAVFSNAALHWMKDARSVVQSVKEALVEGGKFVAEFGGKDNMGTVVQAIEEVLAENYHIDARSLNPWYFPSIGEYSTLLESEGFYVQYAMHYDRPTPMLDGDRGLHHWLDGFASIFFNTLTSEQKQDAYAKIADKTKEQLYKAGTWFMDYKRIRVVAQYIDLK